MRSLQNQMSLQLETAATVAANIKTQKKRGTFTGNMSLPVHGWFRYSAGFSAQWVSSVISELEVATPRILDPFVGSGTALITAEQCYAESVGFEAHPFIFRVARAKLGWREHVNLFSDMSKALLNEARALQNKSSEAVASPLLLKCYEPDTLVKLEKLRHAYLDKFSSYGRVSELIWLAITSILRECSGAGTAQWQYVLPNKRKARVKDPFAAFAEKIESMKIDMQVLQDNFITSPSGEIVLTDARKPNYFPEKKFDLAITSPPYPNNYDYADATRLEMTFWQEINGWGELQGAVRKYLIRACSQHAAAERLVLEELLAHRNLEPIKHEIAAVCRELEVVKDTKGGKKAYHTMIAAYFIDLADVWLSLRGLVNSGGKAAFMIGDSAPYGVYAPADKWLETLALAAGFKSAEFEKVRDRNIKWKNRKHRVPLKEGILVVQG